MIFTISNYKIYIYKSIFTDKKPYVFYPDIYEVTFRFLLRGRRLYPSPIVYLLSLVHNSRQLFTFWGLFSYNVQSDLSCHFGNSRSKTKVVIRFRKTWLLFFPERAQQLSTGCVWYCSSAPLKG